MNKNEVLNKGLTGIFILALLVLLGVQQMRPITVEVKAPDAGALPGPDIASPYLRWGNVAQYNAGPAMIATSSVQCAYQFTATSTIDLVGVHINGNSLGTAETMDVSTSSTQYGSSTPALIKAFAVSSAPTAANPDIVSWQPGVATTSAAGALASLANGGSPYIGYTGQWLTWRVATGTPGVFTTGLSGQCLLRTTRL